MKAPSNLLSQKIPARLEAVDATCQQIRTFLQARGQGSLSFAVELTARECLNNAVLHGGSPDAPGPIEVEVRPGRKWLRLRVADGGPGFDWRRRRRKGLPVSESSSGRGLVLIAQYSQRIRFNQPGNQITVWFSKEPHHGNLP
jgi:anti-sigma regulatory factor (Ser/Thr protein kinase)